MIRTFLPVRPGSDRFTRSGAVLAFGLLVAGAACPAAAQTGTPPATATDPSKSDTEAAVMLVIDASGSMRGRVKGRTKWDVAKETVAKVVGALPPERELGLMAYGHRGGKCNDIEVLTRPARGTGPAIIGTIAEMTPRGETPLSETVRKAAQELKYQSKPATVVVVTDGIESCKQDPCALAAELAGDGIDFTVHVVGFGLNEKEGAQVACLAHNTGGLYIAANDADQLKDALARTLEAPVDVAEPKPEPKVEPKAEPKPEAKPAVFAADFKNGVDLTKWDIVNENKNRYGVVDGRWVVAGARHGRLGNPKRENMLVGKVDLPTGDFDLVAEFSATLGEGTSQVAIGLVKDDQNFVEATLWRNKTYNEIGVGTRRVASGQETVQNAKIGPIGAWHVIADGSPTLKQIDTRGVRLTLSRRGIKVRSTVEILDAPKGDKYTGPVTTEEVSVFELEGKLVFQAGVWGCEFDFQACGENIVRVEKVELRTP